jgi:flagellar hook-associated protein 1 FlgK
MPFSLFGGLEAGKRAILSQQYNLTSIGHNIANVSTPGYSRQQVLLESTTPYEDANGKYGTGVQIATVRQIRDLFLTTQYRDENAQLGRWDAMDRTMSQVESIFMEPNENQLNDLLNNFFNAWQNLTTAADSQTARSAIREQALLLINGLQQASQRLSAVIKNLDDDVSARVSELNQMASEISNINREIAFMELDGNTANDLRDRRDYLIDQLSYKVDVTQIEESTGAARVFIGAMEFIGSGHYTALGTETEATQTMTIRQIVWQGTGTQLGSIGGELASLIEARDAVLPEYITQLDSLVYRLVTEVNALHRTGYGSNDQTGINFFDPNRLTAATVDLSQEVKNSLANIAASSAAASPGNNTIALGIAQLKSAQVLNNGSATMSEFYYSLIGLIGTRAEQAKDTKDNYDLVLEQLEFSRQSVQGVSLDEEMANMIRAQHAYDAAAKVITTIDHAIGTIVNELGVGGR